MKNRGIEDRNLRIGSRLLVGAIAGIAGTLVMTAAMRRLHARLRPDERYPLPPREIIDSASAKADVPLSGETARDATTAAHFAYGAASGALLGAASVTIGPVAGATGGIAIWLGSYMGWIPAAGILMPATRHPARRNLLMLTVHLIWGAATATAMRELVEARGTILAGGKDKDALPPA